MLDARLNRRPVSGPALAVSLAALLAVTIPIAGVAIAQSVFATVAGSVVDPTNGALPDVTLVLTNIHTQAKYEVRSDRTGRYEFAGLAAGDYVLQARLPGFAVLHGKLTVAGQTVQRDLKLQVGSLQETVIVRANAARPDSPSGPRSADLTFRERRRIQSAADCAGKPVQAGPSIGGHIRPPAKLYDVHPQYPAAALNAGVEGAVVLRAVIGSDGNIEDVKVVSSPHPDLGTAAVDAVRQWQFDGTLLNCVPIPVSMGVTVHFQREP